jgi:hypothetical protein
MNYKDEVIYVPNSAIDTNGDSTLQDWLSIEIIFDKYYDAVIDDKSVSFLNELNKYRRYKREFFETKQERRDKQIETILNYE